LLFTGLCYPISQQRFGSLNPFPSRDCELPPVQFNSGIYFSWAGIPRKRFRSESNFSVTFSISSLCVSIVVASISPQPFPHLHCCVPFSASLCPPPRRLCHAPFLGSSVFFVTDFLKLFFKLEVETSPCTELEIPPPPALPPPGLLNLEGGNDEQFFPPRRCSNEFNCSNPFPLLQTRLV